LQGFRRFSAEVVTKRERPDVVDVCTMYAALSLVLRTVRLMTWVENAEPTVQRQRGRWVVRVSGYDAATGRRRVKQLGTFSTKKAAMALLREVQGGRAGGEDEVLQAYLREVWLPSKEARVETSTFQQYVWAVEGHIVPLIGAVRLRDLSPEAVDRWLTGLVALDVDGRSRLGGTSARLVRKVLSMAMEDAVRRGRVPRNPVTLTQPPKLSTVRTRKSWTLQECRRFLAATADHRLFAAFHLALVTGFVAASCSVSVGRTSISAVGPSRWCSSWPSSRVVRC